MTPTQSEGSPGVMVTKTPSSGALRRLALGQTLDRWSFPKARIRRLTTQPASSASATTGEPMAGWRTACRARLQWQSECESVDKSSKSWGCDGGWHAHRWPATAVELWDLKRTPAPPYRFRQCLNWARQPAQGAVRRRHQTLKVLHQQHQHHQHHRHHEHPSS